MKSAKVKQLIHRLGLEFGLTDAEITEIISSQFKFLRDVIAEGDKSKTNYKNFRLTNIGMFHVSERRRAWERKRFLNEEDGKSTG